MELLRQKERDARQVLVIQWGAEAFGNAQMISRRQRALRLFEEAVELCQACGLTPGYMHDMIRHVYANPVGEMWQELGGVGVCLLALAGAVGLSADDCEVREIARVTAKPLEEMARRNKAKCDAGFRVDEEER